MVVTDAHPLRSALRRPAQKPQGLSGVAAPKRDGAEVAVCLGEQARELAGVVEETFRLVELAGLRVGRRQQEDGTGILWGEDTKLRVVRRRLGEIAALPGQVAGE